MNDQSLGERFSRYRAALDAVAGELSVIHRFAPAREQGEEIIGLVYANTPHPGYVTGFTFGLSATERPDSTPSGRELCITMRSDDPEWGKVPARLAASLQRMHPFGKGQAVGYAGTFVEGSKMSSLVFAEPAIYGMGGWDYWSFESRFGDVNSIELIGVYPIYPAERDCVYKSGFDALWNLEWDRFDPFRDPAF
jgi:hypothetical protein